MQYVEPRVFLIGETRIVPEGLDELLEFIGVPDWTSDAPSDGEKLVEVMSRLCYNSFEPGLNPNVTRVRESNQAHLANIVNVKHGSVSEHSTVNFVFGNVSRVFTHELVRHRAGTAMSQESLRFVRLTNLGFWAPTVIREDETAMELMSNMVKAGEELQLRLADLYDLDNEKKFAIKKVVTSAMRRAAPIGLATRIGWTANFRTIRHLLEMRTDPSAEEEIRLVFGQVGRIVLERYPNMFGDYRVKEVDGHPHFTTENSKI